MYIPGHIPILGNKFEDKILENSIESLDECSKYANDNGVMLCIENMPDIEGLLGKDINQLDEIVKGSGCSHYIGCWTRQQHEIHSARDVKISPNKTYTPL